MPEEKFIEMELLEFVTARAESEYGDLSDTWKLLDTKAQGTTAIAGILLAGSIAWFGKAGVHLSRFQAYGTIAVVVFLGLAFTCAIGCMWVRKAQQPPGAPELFEELISLLARPEEEYRERLRNMAADALRKWNQSICRVRDVNQSKSGALRSAYIFLLVGADRKLTP